jgi:hypothetical protein
VAVTGGRAATGGGCWDDRKGDASAIMSPPPLQKWFNNCLRKALFSSWREALKSIFLLFLGVLSGYNHCISHVLPGNNKNHVATPNKY